jgi:hypothetical protein
MPPKVLGLGAPISVQIAVEATEIPALIEAIEDELAHYAHRARSRDEDGEGWSDHVDELRRMRAELQGAAAAGEASFDVVWPTVLAYDVVHGAVRHARHRVASAGAAGAAAAHEGLIAAERTQAAFQAVDGGGPAAVWL